MNELLSTEVLDAEIKKDAQKKAAKILSATEQQIRAIESSVEPRVNDAMAERVKKNEKDLTSFENDLKAAMPLEKERFWVTYMQQATQSAINEYLGSLGDNDRLHLALKNFDNCKKVLGQQKVNIFVYGFDVASVKKTLGKQLTIGNIEKTDFNKIVNEDACGIKNKCGIIIETADKKVRCTLTLSQVFAQLEDEYRVELCDALFGSGSFDKSAAQGK